MSGLDTRIKYQPLHEWLLVEDSNGDVFVVKASDWNGFGIKARGEKDDMEERLVEIESEKGEDWLDGADRNEGNMCDE